MKIQVGSNETLSSGPVAAGGIVTVTPANADECFALLDMRKAVLLDDYPVKVAPGDVGPGSRDIEARQSVQGITLLRGAMPTGVPAGVVLNRIRGNAPTLTDDAGGRLTLSGRSLVSTSTPFTPNSTVNVGVKAADQLAARVFGLVAPSASISAVPTGALFFSDNTPLQFADGSYLELAA